jgi:methionyl-tRNA formyltransferase
VHKIDPEIDTGPIVYQSMFPIADDDTALTLSFKCVGEGIALMLRLLEIAAADPAKIPLRTQDISAREYFGREVPEHGRLSWSWSASKVVNLVRACDYFPFPSPWGHPCTRINAQEFGLVKAVRTGLPTDAPPGTVGKSVASGVHVACQDQWALVGKLLLAGKYLAATEFLRSGDRLEE